MRFFATAAAIVAGLGLGLVTCPAEAQEIDIQYNPAARALLESQLDLTTEQLDELITDEIRALYGLVDTATFLRLSANAQGMANKGLGVDYASNVDGWIFGVGFSVAVAPGEADVEGANALADGNTERAVPVSAGAQISLMAGYTVADRLTLFANALYYPLDDQGLDGSFYNFGLHAQYKAVRPMGRRAVAQWGGLDLTAGLEVSRMFLSLSDEFEASGTLEPGVDLDTVSTGTLELEQRALTIPLEATSNVTLLYFLTLYGGVALDFQLGDAKMNFDLDSQLTTANPVDGGPLDLGQATIRADELGDPNLVMFRLLVGAQINVWRLKIFSQLNFLTADQTVGVAAGLRLVI